jgi:hypothetical protein
MTITSTAPTPTPLNQATPLTPATTAANSVSFGDLMDALNPLQHIPVVSSLYRAVTGSTISAGSQVAGDTLYGAAMGGGGAVLGLASSLANVAVKTVTGKDIGGNVVSAVNNITFPSSVGTTAKPVLLVGDSSSVTAAAIAANPPVTLPTTLLSFFPQPVSARAVGEYQRAQIHSALNKHLIKMAV